MASLRKMQKQRTGSLGCNVENEECNVDVYQGCNVEINQECNVDIVADTIIDFQGRKLPQSRAEEEGGGGGGHRHAARRRFTPCVHSYPLCSKSYGKSLHFSVQNFLETNLHPPFPAYHAFANCCSCTTGSKLPFMRRLVTFWLHSGN